MLIWSWSLLKLLVTLLIDVMIWVFDQNPSDLKVEFSKDKRNIEKEKKHMRILSRENYFWTRNWPGLVNGKRYDTKVCYEGITNNGDEWESKCPDRLLAYKGLIINKNRFAGSYLFNKLKKKLISFKTYKPLSNKI